MTARTVTGAAGAAAAHRDLTGRDLAGEMAFLTRALKAPTLREAVPRLAQRARAESWTHEEFLVACLQREVSARESHAGEGRIRAARFPARKSLAPAKPATASCSPPPANGSPGSPTPTTPARCNPNWSGSAATRCSCRAAAAAAARDTRT